MRDKLGHARSAEDLNMRPPVASMLDHDREAVEAGL
jgi:hypothetical protein